MARKRNKILVGRLVASTDKIRNIMGKRLEVEVKYVTSGLTNRIISQNVIGVKASIYY